MQKQFNFVVKAINYLQFAIRNYRLIFSLVDYWNELAKLDWWLLTEDEALEMPERFRDEQNKLLILMEIAEFSNCHERLLAGFFAFGMLGHPRPARPNI